MTGSGRTPQTLALAALGAMLLVGVAAAGPIAAPAQDGAIYEVRNYHFDPARFEEYAEVAKGEYIRYLREHLDLVGFWIESGVPAEVRGAEQDELGPANVTWVIRWASKEERDEKLPASPRHAGMA